MKIVKDELTVPGLMQDGRFVLIHDGKVTGAFANYQDAVGAGREEYGSGRFLVKLTLAKAG